MISAVLFDLDGTLLDTAPDFETATNQLLEDEGLARLPLGGIRTHVTNGSVGIIRSIFNLEPGDPAFERLRNQLLNYYRACLTEKTHVFPGLETSLSLLKEQQIPWGIVTNKPSEYAEPIVETLLPDCAILICPDHVQQPKPDPESLFLACARIGVNAENCLFIGDHKRDIDAGRAAGMETVAVAWGYIDHDREDLENWQATHLIGEPVQLTEILTAHYM